MNHTILIPTLFAMLSLGACDRAPTVINMPAEQVAVPGPMGPQGDTGSQGAQGMMGNEGMQGNRGMQGYQGNEGSQGATGETGKTGDATTIVVVPPAPAN
ncbi:MAG: hypothetical protein WC474_13270 [Hydrogenophilaceae bacterium]